MNEDIRARVRRGSDGWWFVTLNWLSFPANTFAYRTFGQAMKWATIEVQTERKMRWQFHG